MLRTLSRFTSAPTASGTVHEAAERGSVQGLQRHADVARELGYPDRDTLTRPDVLLGATPLHYAAENGHVHVLEVRGSILSPSFFFFFPFLRKWTVLFWVHTLEAGAFWVYMYARVYCWSLGHEKLGGNAPKHFGEEERAMGTKRRGRL
jgi:hypothetical protein